MNIRKILNKTYKLYSKDKIDREQLPDVALEEARRKIAALKFAKITLNTVGYPFAGIFGASSLIPGFIAFDAVAASIRTGNPLAYVYGFGSAFGFGGCALIFTAILTSKMNKTAKTLLSIPVGIAGIIPAFLGFDASFANAEPLIKNLYSYSLWIGALGLGLGGFYFGKAVHALASKIDRKIEMLRRIQDLEKEDIVKLFEQ
ncbi:MAG: hypothetical protein QXL47_00995 [Candidatus Anstonellales archaeon]